MGVKCFWTEPTPDVARWLRRYRSRGDHPCPHMPSSYSYHQAMTRIENAAGEFDERGYLQAADGKWPRDDPRWPTACPCGYVFEPTDEWQLFRERIYVRPDTGERFEEGADKMPPGAMYNAFWVGDYAQGPDGMSLVVICPGGKAWHIDSRASNCDMPDDNVHRCWVRHGVPPLITVDKNGVTCGAGAGSILQPNYHGFLTNGEFHP